MLNVTVSLAKKVVLVFMLLGWHTAYGITRQESLVHLILWHAYQGEERAALEQIVEQYNQQRSHEKVKIKPIAIAFEIYQESLRNHLPQGKGPDLFIAPHDPIGRWVESKDMLEPMSYILPDAPWLARFAPPALQAMRYQGDLYGVPLNFKVPTLIYNRQLVHTLPSTFEEWVAFSRQFSNPTEQKYGLLFEYNNLYFHSAFANAFNTQWFNESVPYLNQSGLVTSFKYVYEHLVKSDLMPSSVSHAYMQKLFNQKKVAAVISGPWFLSDLEPSLDVDFTLLPILSQQNPLQLMPWSTVEGVFISRNSKYKYQAADFIEFLTNLQSAQTMALVGKQLPSNQMVYPLPEMQDNKALQAFKNQMLDSIPMPNDPQIGQIWAPASYAMQQVSVGVSVQEAFDWAQRKVESSHY